MKIIKQGAAEKAAFFFYDLAWKLAVPLLRRNQRLAEGFEARRLRQGIPEPANLWIQAASAGEAYLAGSLIENLKPAGPANILLTSNTRQGMDILRQAVDNIAGNDRGLRAEIAYFPFDAPSIMDKAVRDIRPEVMVLLESEIWPGLLSALKKYGCRVLIINGRLTNKSLKRYRIWPRLWLSLRPDKVLAVSEDDAERFTLLFGNQGIELMPNIKFERIGNSLFFSDNPLGNILPAHIPFLILGSVGDEEEMLVEKMILRIHSRRSDIGIGLFPRHIHRTEHWKARLKRIGIPCILRSELPECGNEIFAKAGVILWDKFGELFPAYRLSKAAYVGGSLVPLGGQNFLEPLIAGIVPVIGPHWETFAWAAPELIEQGLVRVASDWKEAVEILLGQIENSPSPEDIRSFFFAYLMSRQGGTARSCERIAEFLDLRPDRTRIFGLR